MLRRAVFIGLLCSLVAAWPLPVSAQARNEVRLIVTVVDQTGAVIPAATVTIVGIEDATRKAGVAPAKTSDRGLAIFEHLAPGRYSLTNHPNYVGYSGVMTSPFFLTPTAVDGVRTVRASVGVSF